MDQQRGRSPSVGQQAPHINPSHSPSPQQFAESANPVGLGLETGSSSTNTNTNPSGSSNSNNNSNQQFNNGGFNSNSEPTAFDNSEFGDSNFNQQQPSFTQELLSANSFGDGDFSLFSTSNAPSDQFDSKFFMNDVATRPGNVSVNPAELNMSSPPHHAQTPPGLLQPDARSPPPHQSPSFNQGQFQSSPAHSRHASLGPESAAFPQGVDWTMMPPQFQNHRRTPSEYSDVSASSAAPSPNLGHQDTFDNIEHHHSPMQHPQDPMYQEVLGIGNFSLSDNHGASPRAGLSPAHSPHISPRLGPQQLPTMGQPSFVLGMGNEFAQPQHMYGGQMQDIPQIQQNGGSIDLSDNQQMVPPQINVEFAPNAGRSGFDGPKPSAFDTDALTPPDRGRRRRAHSDPYNSASSGSRPHTPANLSPDLGLTRPSEASRSLSPNDRSGAGSPSRRRQSTSSLPNREYILGLADPEYQAVSADNGNAKRVQKHPATFQCTLCPKRFTRAYNLRSHLRTHTDERPFVCTVCGKAFARQHDRKRHEGLHSGEKKFVCKGDLKQGGQWGCGRRFARADALGRHFRSEAGRICIKPLLDEEAIERQRVWQEQRMQNMHNMQQPQQIAVDANGFPMDASGNYALPAALLAQYPALATLSWSELPQGDVGVDDDPSGRSSFDASGSEYYDEGDDGGYLSSGPGPQQGFGQGQMNEVYSVYPELGGQ